MPFDFAASPTIGQTYTVGGITYVWDGEKWLIQGTPIPQVKTAQAKQILVNPVMQVSQENGNAVNAGALSAYYAADQWFGDMSASGAAATLGRVQIANTSGSNYRLELKVTTAKASLGTSDYCAIFQNVEGYRFQSLNWVAGGPLDALLVFKFLPPAAGTYTAIIRNAPSNSTSFAASLVCAGPWVHSFAIKVPGPLSASWQMSNLLGMQLVICIACGTGIQAPAAGWNNGGWLGLTGMSNGLGALGTFQLWDVGLHPDPDKTGVAPPFIVPDWEDDLRDCRRYYEKTGIIDVMGYSTAAGWIKQTVSWTEKRVAPTLALVGTPTYSNTATVSFTAQGTYGVGVAYQATATGSAYAQNVVIAANARP